MLNIKTLKNEELAAYTLRSLYSRFGYTRYKMSKFEEYDLYVRNKDFLISDGIITFTDTSGKLLALKPDVTLSIIKNSKDIKGSTQKLYYDENVYRISGGSNSFKEIMQTGLECIGDVSLYDICEVLYLAVQSLALIEENYLLDLSHAGLFSALLKLSGVENEVRQAAVRAVADKNRDAVTALYNDGTINDTAKDILFKLITDYKCISDLKENLNEYLYDENVKACFDDFEAIYNFLRENAEQEKIRIDFSIVSDTGYYSGIVFKGYIKNIPQSVLSGGRYDKLMRKMGKNSGAVGFAVYLDMLERHNFSENEYDYDYLLIKNAFADNSAIINKVLELSKNGETVKVAEEIPNGIKYRQLVDLREEN